MVSMVGAPVVLLQAMAYITLDAILEIVSFVMAVQSRNFRVLHWNRTLQVALLTAQEASTVPDAALET